MKKLLALLLLAATPLFANPFLVCPAVTSGVSNSPVTYTVSGLPNSPIVSNAVTITSGTVQLDLDLGPAGQNVPSGSYTVSATATNPNGTSAASANFGLTIAANQALALSGSGQYLSVSNGIVSAYPYSFVCWVKIASLPSANSALISLGSTSTSNEYTELYVSTTGAVGGWSDDTNGGVGAITTATMSTGAWHLAVAVFSSATSRTVYLDGANAASNTTSRTPTGFNASGLGVVFTGTGTAHSLLTGSIAYCTIYNVALTSTDVTNLWNSGSGVAPNTIESSNVVSYSPFQGSSPWADGVSTNTWTTTGSPTTGTAPF